MKHYITFLLLLILPLTAFAEGTINLTTTSTTPKNWETFEVEVQIQFDSLTPISDITIPGIENFTVFSTMQQESTQILGEQVQKTTSIFLQLTPNTQWVYTIGPVSGSFSGELMTSNTLTITVWDTQITPPVVNNSWSTPELEVSPESDSQQIEWLREPDKKSIYMLIFLVIFGVIFFYILQRFFSRDTENIPENIPEKQKEEIPYTSQLQKLSEDSGSYSKSEFYEKLHGIVRKYFSEVLNIKNADTLTLVEIEPYLKDNTSLLSVFSRSYQIEFNEQEDSVSERKQIISEYTQLL